MSQPRTAQVLHLGRYRSDPATPASSTPSLGTDDDLADQLSHLSSAYESPALRLTYLDAGGRLQRLTLSSTGRLAPAHSNADEARCAFLARLSHAFSALGAEVQGVEPLSSMCIEI